MGYTTARRSGMEVKTLRKELMSESILPDVLPELPPCPTDPSAAERRAPEMFECGKYMKRARRYEYIHLKITDSPQSRSFAVLVRESLEIGSRGARCRERKVVVTEAVTKIGFRSGSFSTARRARSQYAAYLLLSNIRRRPSVVC